MSQVKTLTINDQEFELVASYDEGCEDGCCKSFMGYLLMPVETRNELPETPGFEGTRESLDSLSVKPKE
jgi:hypothetical protein